ncbi:hypothetical protein [Photobacterium sanguinicancri]|uniref:hypothetical protein n=2 Tax=Photobacterium sanguinicancri TaxID=875932 RepID=UPI003D0A6CB5
MTNVEIITIVLGSNAITLTAAIYIANIRSQRADDLIKNADKLRDATIESLKVSNTSVEKELSGLKQHVALIEAKLKDHEDKLGRLRIEAHRLKVVLLKTSRSFTQYKKIISNQLSNIDKLEGELLDISKIVIDNKLSNTELDRKLRRVNRAVEIVEVALIELNSKFEREKRALEDFEPA